MRLMNFLKSRIRAVLLLFGCALVTVVVCARGLPDHSWESLSKKADLIVVLTPLRQEPSSVSIKDRGNPWPADCFSGVVTTFKVEAVLKGTADKELKVLHYKPSKSAMESHSLSYNGPGLIDFKLGVKRTVQIVWKENGGDANLQTGYPSEWIACLKEGDGGVWVPVTGHVDSALSFRALLREH